MNGEGSVILVGAGPGDAGLLTLRGKEALETADVILYDRLVGDEILSLIPESALKIDVGKEAGCHSIPQQEITALLARYAREGKRVARLKGGDPYLFGRGAEEVEALAAANIPFAVVPGVTSATAVPAYAGIPVSHREFASSAHVITAHRKNGAPPEIDYESLVKLGGTLIFLMSLSSIDSVAAGLTAAGMDAKTPAALIENGTRPNQRKRVASVAEMPALAKEMEFRAPTLLVVGEVCGLSETFDWFSRLPLKGARVLVTRPKAESGLSRKLRALGADVTDFPCVHAEPLPVPDAMLDDLAAYEWIVFTSPAGAKLFFAALKTRGVDIRTPRRARFAAVGPKTAAAIADRGIRVDYTPETYNARALASGLPREERTGARVLLFRASDGTPALASSLRARGFVVEDIAAYKTVRESDCSEETREKFSRSGFDFVAFTSASTVQGFAGSLPGFDRARVTAICIGPETAAEARARGFRALISEQATTESMIERIREEWKK